MKTTQYLDDAEAVGGPTRATKEEDYDLLILGSGAAGKLLSWTLAKKGMKTAVIERINSGTRDAIETTPGSREANPLTHLEALELDRVPEHLIVLGGRLCRPRIGAGDAPLWQPRDCR